MLEDNPLSPNGFPFRRVELLACIKQRKQLKRLLKLKIRLELSNMLIIKTWKDSGLNEFTWNLG